MTDTTTDTDTGDDTAGLKAKVTELLGKLKTADKTNQTLNERLTSLEQDRTDAIDSTKSEGDKALAKLQRELDKATADVVARDARLGSLLIDNAVKEALTTNNVLPQFAKAVEAMLRAGAKIENGEAFAADGTPLAEANAAFFKSADAKHFVAARTGSGAGAPGNTIVTPRFTKPPVTHEELTAWDRAAKENPAEAAALADSWGLPHLKP